MSLDLLLVNAIVGVILPALVALVAKAAAPDWVKAIVNLALSAIAGVLTPLVVAGNQPVDWKTIALSVLQTFVISVVAHFGLLKPSGLTGSAGVVANAVPGGVGTVDPIKANLIAQTSPLEQGNPPASP